MPLSHMQRLLCFIFALTNLEAGGVPTYRDFSHPNLAGRRSDRWVSGSWPGRLNTPLAPFVAGQRAAAPVLSIRRPATTVNQALATAPKVPSRRRFLGYPASSSGCTRDAVEATADDLPASFAHMWAGSLHLRNANVSSGSSGSISAGSTRQRRLPRRLQHACGATGRIRGHGDRWCRVAPSCVHRE